uniref:uncharacterized protein LOC117608815 n=1 Tax=Osmia lignaria TaxID=473952 RepID=UPI0014792E2A|nr:uncharacterized protein LOC117608815 [Osmia lignaria]XP_034190335.1 uncharacterized protein LOC117608815 [Osmia lignaria]
MSASVSFSSKFQPPSIHIEPDSARPQSRSQLPSSPDSHLHQLTLLFQDLTYGLEELGPIEKQVAHILNRGLSHPNFIMKDFWNSYRVEINTWITSRKQEILMCFKESVEMGPHAVRAYIEGVVIGKKMAESNPANYLLFDLYKKATDMAIQDEIYQKQSDKSAREMKNAIEHVNSTVRDLQRVVSTMVRSESIQPPPSPQILYQAPSRESSSEPQVGGPDTSDSSYRAKRRIKRMFTKRLEGNGAYENEKLYIKIVKQRVCSLDIRDEKLHPRSDWQTHGVSEIFFEPGPLCSFSLVCFKSIMSF